MMKRTEELQAAEGGDERVGSAHRHLELSAKLLEALAAVSERLKHTDLHG